MGVLSVLNNFRLAPKKFVIISLILGIFLILPNDTQSVSSQTDRDETVHLAKLPFCDDSVIQNRESSKRLLYVTTLDGTLSTLDLTKNGTLHWKVDTDPGDLLSSSIHNMELTNNGKMVRMIPSLSGGIYKFDGDSIEAIPVTADELLKSSFKFSDDLVISGGRETRSYGISSRTGKIIYECSMNGCKNLTETSLNEDVLEKSPKTGFDPLLDDVVVIRRQTQTVRAVDPRSGSERWNFSIGHHEVELLQSDGCQPGARDSSKNNDIDQLILDLEFRVIVPEGIVCAYSKKKPNVILWKHQFDHPIVSVFRSDQDDKLYSVDLFKNAQWLWNNRDDFFMKTSGNDDMAPSLYLGMYNKQLYIQESELMKNSVQHHVNIQQNLISDETDFPKIPFKPYPASSTALKLIEADYLFEDEEEGEKKDLFEVMQIDVTSTKLSVLNASPFVNGNGFYFYSSKGYNKSAKCQNKKSGRSTKEEDLVNITFPNETGIVVSSLWDYWKEVIVIALTTAIVVNFMLNNRAQTKREVVFVERHIEIPVPMGKEAMEFEEEEQQKKTTEKLYQKMRSISESTSGGVVGDNYSSRFMNDFDVTQCLGKGGFGVVFEAKNKLDDCNYAIKRIILPSKQEHRDRVMREVKTLANCEHKNIVRYFQAWVEQPPCGWQEEKDKELLARDILSTSITIDSPSPTNESKAFAIHSELKSTNYKSTTDGSWIANIQHNDYQNFDKEFNKSNIIMNSTLADDTSSFIQFQASNNVSYTNDDDIIFKNSSITDADNGDDSFDIEFKNSTNDDTSLDDSHVISVNCSSSNNNNHSSTASKRNVFKKTHRRPLSLDLSRRGAILSKKLNNISITTNSSNKMYLYIQMQLCMKQSLKDWLRANDLQMRNGKTYEIFDQIVSAVHYVHLKGMIHRDLKPSNIFFALDGQIKIGDFGLVTDMCDIPVDPLTSCSGSSVNGSGSNSDFTVVGHKKHTQRVGTHLYMSPEQANGLPYNYKVDIYSLGLILFELLVYFGTEFERFKVLEGVRNHNYPTDFQESFEDEYQLLQLMMAKKPEERPTTFGIKARPPLKKQDEEQVSIEWHFELPMIRRRDSNHHHSSTSLSSK